MRAGKALYAPGTTGAETKLNLFTPALFTPTTPSMFTHTVHAF